MIELLEGKATERVPLLLTPKMKSAVRAMAKSRNQTVSDFLRFLVAREAEREGEYVLGGS